MTTALAVWKIDLFDRAAGANVFFFVQSVVLKTGSALTTTFANTASRAYGRKWLWLR